MAVKKVHAPFEHNVTSIDCKFKSERAACGKMAASADRPLIDQLRGRDI